MPRPPRRRRICTYPDHLRFVPEGEAPAAAVELTMEEYETIRLIDHEGMTHAQCAAQMEIGRSTVTETYESARRKVSQLLVEGRALVISGGSYRLCDGNGCASSCCVHRQIALPALEKKGTNTMRIAVTYENGNIFQHFGHTAQFKLYDVENGAVSSASVVDTNGSGHGALAGFLAANQVDTLICGGIGGGAQMALAEAGIKLYGGVSGSADDAVAALIAGNLGYDPNVRCNHHDHEHGEGGHTCGSHGCGGHSCGNH